MKKIFLSCYNWLLKFLELQLFITICSLPIFVYWGLPISAMTVLGNLLFSPFLTAFIFTAALIFITEVFYIPNNIIIHALEIITHYWLYLLSLGDKSWLIGLKSNYFLLSFIPFLGAFFIIKSSLKRERKIVLLCFLIVPTTFFIHTFPTTASQVRELYLGKTKITLLINKKKTILVENGLFSKKSARSFVKYKILPEIIKATGKPEVDTIIFNNFSKRTLDNLQFAHSLMKIDTLVCKKKNPPSYLMEKIKNYCMQEKIKIKQEILST